MDFKVQNKLRKMKYTFDASTYDKLYPSNCLFNFREINIKARNRAFKDQNAKWSVLVSAIWVNYRTLISQRFQN